MPPEAETEVQDTVSPEEALVQSGVTDQEPVADTKEQAEESKINWYDANTWKELEGLPESSKKAIQDRLKEIQGHSDRVINKRLGEQKKYQFSSAEELKKLVEEDKNLAFELQSIREQEEQLDQHAQESSFSHRRQFIQNWGNLTETQKRSVLGNMDDVQQSLFLQELKDYWREQSESRQRLEDLDRKNEEKYGESYKNLQNEIMDFLRKNSNRVENSKEIAFKVLNYDKYGEEMYKKGLAEKGKLGTGLQNVHGIGESTGASVKENQGAGMEGAFQAALEGASMEKDQFLGLFGR